MDKWSIPHLVRKYKKWAQSMRLSQKARQLARPLGQKDSSRSLEGTPTGAKGSLILTLKGRIYFFKKKNE